MNLDLTLGIAEPYKSPSQKTRVLTEAWARENLYCPACESNSITKTQDNTPSIDFVCPTCGALFQLKATRRLGWRKIPDAAYSQMIQALLEDRFPHLIVLRYDLLRARVTDLLLVPRFALPVSAIEARPPLSSSARRAGWIGCNIILDLVPPEGRISLVRSEIVTAVALVRSAFAKLKGLEQLSGSKRGWTLDLLNVLRTLGKKTFTLSDAYSFEQVLGRRHPENRNLRAKIRQQLQVLRDLGYIEFLSRGVYRWRDSAPQ
jgi:type II restriction enzyme